jgi:acetyl/propionyl-CoA carboxylase alpha subunit
MLRAIADYKITGVETTLPFCSFVLKHKAFISGDFDTHFVKNFFKPEFLAVQDEKEEEIAALFAARLASSLKQKPALTAQAGSVSSKWKRNRLEQS